MEKILAIKELMKLIQDKDGKYNSSKAKKVYEKYSKNQTPENKRLLAKRLSLAKWKLPKVKEALKEGNAQEAMRGTLCGLCFWNEDLYSRLEFCKGCHKRGFDCYNFDMNRIKLENEKMLAKIRKQF